LLVLLAAAGFVVVVLPKWVERETAALPVPAAPSSTSNPTPNPARDRNLQALADAKQAFETLRPKVAARLDALEKRGAGVWGGDSFARGKRGVADADAAFTRRDYAAALASLKSADVKFVATEKLAAGELKSSLAAGRAALDAGNAADARRWFERALRIEPANAVAKRGLERAGTLDEVRALLADAQAREVRGDVAGAQAAYRKALELDRDTQAAREALARIEGQAAGSAFAAAMSRGLDSLTRKDYSAARQAFEQAGRIRPGAPEVADGLAQVERALGDRTIAGHLSAAQQAEAAERWPEAVAEYRKALELDRNLLTAQQGLERAEPRAMLDAELNTYVDKPERLYSPDVRNAARRAIERARAVPSRGPVLERQIGAVERLVTAAETPLKVALTSDNLTEVTIYRVGRIGVFERRDVELLPGRYTVVGVRAGYRDVRHELTILPGREAPAVTIRCEEPI
jgi:tetratricopeptide (TPR) repeat protein